MKLKNKKTREIGEITAYDSDKGIFCVSPQGHSNVYYYSLADLCKEWEDVPEEEKWEPEDIAWSESLNIEIAANDYWEDNEHEKKTHFTWDEAMEIEKKLNNGWRLPTRHEWVMLAEDSGQDKNGKLSSEKLEKNLNLKKNGYYDGIYGLVGPDGYYWSSTAYSATDAYNVYFTASNVNPQDSNYKSYGFSVRLVRGLGGEEW